MTDWESQIGDYANTLVTLTEAGDAGPVAAFMSKLELVELRAVAVALARGLLDQEAANTALADRNAVLEGGNVALFRERNVLTGKVAELRSMLDDHARRSPGKRVAA